MGVPGGEGADPGKVIAVGQHRSIRWRIPKRPVVLGRDQHVRVIRGAGLVEARAYQRGVGAFCGHQ